MTRCSDIPVSHLRLEQLALGELSDDQSTAYRAHLEACPACQRCFDAIGADARSMPRLELPQVSAPFFSPARLRWLLGGGALVAAAAALLFVLLPPAGSSDSSEASLSRRVAIKGGGEMVLSVVRERGGALEMNATSFRDGDRLKLSLTCTVPGDVGLDVAVFQARETFRPLGTPRIRCGNNTIVPGAFAATGPEPLTICVAPEPERPLTFRRRGDAACVILEASPGR